MNGVVHAVRLEMNKPAQKVSLSMRRGDTTTQQLRITLSRNGSVMNLSRAVMAIFKATKPDDMLIDNDCTISGNEIFLEITNQTIAALGEVRCNIEVIFRNEDTITSPEFFIWVYDNQQTQDTYIESTNEYMAAAAMVAIAADNAEQAERAVLLAEQTLEHTQEVAAQVTEDKIITGQKAEEASIAADAATNAAERAETSAQEALAAEVNTAASEANAAGSAAAAALSEENAAESERNAAESERNALNYRDDALIYKNDAQISSDLSHQYQRLAQSYAIGTNGEVREGDDLDNAEYYAKKAEEIVSGSYIPYFYISDEGQLIMVKTYVGEPKEDTFTFYIKDHKSLEVAFNVGEED